MPSELEARIKSHLRRWHHLGCQKSLTDLSMTFSVGSVKGVWSVVVVVVNDSGDKMAQRFVTPTRYVYHDGRLGVRCVRWSGSEKWLSLGGFPSERKDSDKNWDGYMP